MRGVGHKGGRIPIRVLLNVCACDGGRGLSGSRDPAAWGAFIDPGNSDLQLPVADRACSIEEETMPTCVVGELLHWVGRHCGLPDEGWSICCKIEMLGLERD